MFHQYLISRQVDICIVLDNTIAYVNDTSIIIIQKLNSHRSYGNNGSTWRSEHYADTFRRMPMPTCLDS